jgi:hypothetical protein
MNFLEETREASLQCRRRKRMALISDVMYVYINFPRNCVSLLISVNNRKDAGAHQKGK